MKLSFQLAVPAGVSTLLVSTPVPRDAYEPITRRLLAIGELNARQVGFLTPPAGEGAVRLEMAGGRFSGTALAAAGLAYAVQQGIRRSRKLLVECEGSREPLTVQVNPLTSQVAVQLPAPRIIHGTLFGEPSQAAVFPGVVQGVTQTAKEISEEEFRTTLRDLAARYSLPAAGAVIWKGRTLRPVLYTAADDELTFPVSSATGAAAAAVWSAMGSRKDGGYKLDLRQPGGKLHTTAAVRQGRLQELTVTLPVTLGPEYDVTF